MSRRPKSGDCARWYETGFDGENRRDTGEPRQIFAEFGHGGWKFYVQYASEVMSSPEPATQDLVKRANEEWHKSQSEDKPNA